MCNEIEQARPEQAKVEANRSEAPRPLSMQIGVRKRPTSEVVVELSVERHELEIKIKRLTAALGADIPDISEKHKACMALQLASMKEYHATLGKRIIDLIETTTL